MVLQSPAVQRTWPERDQMQRLDVQTQGVGLDAGVGGHLGEDGTEFNALNIKHSR